MKEIKNILVCVDCSDNARGTIEYAMTLVREYAQKILVISVVNTEYFRADASASSYCPEMFNFIDHVWRERINRYRFLNKILGQYFPSDEENIEVDICLGNPLGEILKAVQTKDIDLVIIGNKDSGDFTKPLLGSNAEKVFRHSPVSVLSVRERQHVKYA